MKTNVPSFKFILLTILFFSSVILISAFLNRIMWQFQIEKVIEGVLCLIVLMIVVSQKSIQQYFKAVPRPHKIIFLIFFFCMGIAQYITTPKKTFPFPTWNMYAEILTDKKIVFFTYRGMTADGKEVNINTSHVFPPERLFHYLEKRIESVVSQEDREPLEATLTQRPAENPGVLKNAARWTRSVLIRQTLPDIETQKQQLTEMLEAMAKMYNRQHPDTQIKSIVVVRGILDYEDTYLADIKEDIVWKVDLK